MQRHLREGSEICDELIATDRLLGSNDEEDEDLIDPERLTYFQVKNIQYILYTTFGGCENDGPGDMLTILTM